MYRKRKAGQQMKAKFEEFNDGIADVCNVNGEDRLEKIIVPAAPAPAA